jgi:hypothetical protein
MSARFEAKISATSQHDRHHVSATGGDLFHGTSKRNARKILKEGFRDWSWTAETPLLKYKAKRGEARWMHGGSYGRGTYVTCNWRAALHFGPVLFRVELQPGTRVVRLDAQPDGRLIDSLTREFGREILSKSPWKVMPKNKQLTLDQAIQLARHHVTRWEGASWCDPRGQKHESLMLDLRKILVRYGIQGWGEPADLGGIVIFATDRLKVREVVLSLPSEDLWLECFGPGKTAGCFASLDAMVRVCQTATNRGAANSLRWVEQSNGSRRDGESGYDTSPSVFLPNCLASKSHKS